MAEEDSELELERFNAELQSLLQSGEGDEAGLRSRIYCRSFCQLVEEHTSRWHVPLPQLQVLRSALCAFVPGAASFPSDCEHVRYTLSSLALSVFELLLFFGRDEFPEDPLKDILDSFQECYSSLVRYQNVYLLQVRQVIKDGGPWASPVLQDVLKELDRPQTEVDRYLSSEVPLFFELRVRYLLACERYQEAMALAQKCSQHLTVGRHLFFKQAYLTCLWKTSQKERLFKEMSEIDGKDAVEILCIAEKEVKAELLLELSRGFLLQQLRSGDMYYLWDLVFIWCKIFLRVKPSKQDLLEECRLLILSASNIKAIFPFMKVILEGHLGRDGLTFCMELCARALQTDLKNDPVTKSLIYKTIAYLLPSDLEICRACALLVFFLERTIEAYKTVFLLYTHPDQEYYLDTCPVENHVRFEVIRILKKGLFFDPEFWSLLNIKTNCLKLMSDKAALSEIMEEDKWVHNYCANGHCKCRVEPERTEVNTVARTDGVKNQESGVVDKKLASTGNVSSKFLPPKRRGRRPGTQISKDLDPCPVRRSFRQLDLAQNHSRQLSSRYQRFISRQSDKKNLKRRGRKPRWLLEELASQAENSVPRQGKKPGRPKKLYQLKDIAADTPVIEITMELSYPDNEVDLPADVQIRSTSAMNSTTESIRQEISSQPEETSDSCCQVQTEKSILSWTENVKSTEEFVFQAQESIAFVRKFHNYVKVPDEEGSIVNDVDDNVASDPHALEQEMQSEVPASEKIDATVPVKVNAAVETEMNLLTPAVQKNDSVPLAGTVDATKALVLETHPGQKLSVTPVEVGMSLGNVHNTLQNSTVAPSAEETNTLIADTISTPEKAPEKAADKRFSPDNTQNKKDTNHVCSSDCELGKATEKVSTPENASKMTSNTTHLPETLPQRPTDSMSILEKGSEASVAPREMSCVFENASVIGSSLKKPAEEKVQEPAVCPTGKEEPCVRCPVTDTSDSLPIPQTDEQFSHRCRLCNKEYFNVAIMEHAFWHYRHERKCMFCPNFTYSRSPLCHFKMHIKKLKERLAEEKTCQSLSEQPAKPDQTVHVAVPKKARPGLAQIKSKLLMRLNFRRATPHKAENKTDIDEKMLKPSITKQSASIQDPEVEKDKEESAPKMQRRYLTRGLIRKSESKGRFLRKRLARKAKSRTLMKDREASASKDGPACRLNGVIRKKQAMKRSKQESKFATDKNTQATTRQENKEQKSDVGSEDRSECQVNLLQKPEINKKRNKMEMQKGDAKRVKKRKIDTGTNEQKQKDRNDTVKPTDEQENAGASLTNTTKQASEAEAKPNETSEPVQKNKKRPALTVRCPGEMCTFTARPGPVLSHVLIHHSDDTKALEFFYHFGKQKCLFCSRRIWTPQHFFDHIASHRGNLKHLCYHMDCKERFKTRLELTDHMLKEHQPLRAVCCFPGCTVQASNPMFLYSHERGHYKVDVKESKCKEKKLDQVCSKTATPKSNVVEMQQTPESTEFITRTEQERSAATPAEVQDETLMTLNKGSLNYTTKSPKLVNGHIDPQREALVKTPASAPKEQETDFGKTNIKPFVRPPPSEYLDELHISMPKRWKGPQVSSHGFHAVEVVKRPVCPRCSASFNSEEELQGHREKCTSLFGFDSDDESAS
ncbi:uncharacterized protein znf654 [Hoplias malabaricus]|uniref:uncharacterized protein znf654 n=1 Tax=Hoplias malabaricus TaxID=27720 RepID=UPI0034633451